MKNLKSTRMNEKYNFEMETPVVYNFGAGPSTMPRSVLETAQRELLSWNGCGYSVLEMSHRSREFEQHILHSAQARLRRLLHIPTNYHILFMQGGGSGQFSAVPLNFFPKDSHVQPTYLVSGAWSRLAAKEATKYGPVRIFDITKRNQQDNCIELSYDGCDGTDGTDGYTYYCDNETIDGIEFPGFPCLSNNRNPESFFVSDMSSNFLSRPIPVDRYGCIFAGAQKNFGPAGLVVAIVREDLLHRARADTPSILHYKLFSETNSMPNTPPTFGIYLAERMFEWIEQNGGVEGMERQSTEKSDLLYSTIDESTLYRCPVSKSCRSRMNVVFRMPTETDENRFLDYAFGRGLLQLRGHRSVGGIRASLYNAMPIEGVQALVDAMKDFDG